MSELKIVTNNVPRDILTYFDLSEKERNQFDWDGADEHRFIRYKGSVTPLENFLRFPEGTFPAGWQGAASDSYFSGLLIKFTEDFEQAIIGSYFS